MRLCGVHDDAFVYLQICAPVVKRLHVCVRAGVGLYEGSLFWKVTTFRLILASLRGSLKVKTSGLRCGYIWDSPRVGVGHDVVNRECRMSITFLASANVQTCVFVCVV